MGVCVQCMKDIDKWMGVRAIASEILWCDMCESLTEERVKFAFMCVCVSKWPCDQWSAMSWVSVMRQWKGEWVAWVVSGASR